MQWFSILRNHIDLCWFFWDILLSVLLGLFPFSFPSIIALGYKSPPFSSFLHPISSQQEPNTDSHACHIAPAAAKGRRRQAASHAAATWLRELADAPLPTFSPQLLPSTPSLAATPSWALAGSRRCTWVKATGCLLIVLIFFFFFLFLIEKTTTSKHIK